MELDTEKNICHNNGYIDISLAIIYIPYLSFLKAKWNGKGIGSVEKSASIKAICLLNIWIMQNDGLNN